MDLWIQTVISGLLGALAATVLTLWFQRHESRRQATFGLLQVVQERASRTRKWPSSKCQADLLAFYGSEGGELSAGAAAYLDYLESLEFLLLAIEKRWVDGTVSRVWLKDLLAADADDAAFLRRFRELTGNNSALEYLMRHHSEGLRQLPSSKRGDT